MIERFWHRPASGVMRYGIALALLAAATLPIALLHELLPGPNFSVLYLPVVIAVAILFGPRPALATALQAFLLYDLLFITPRFLLTVADPIEWANLSAFLAAALATGQLASFARRRAVQATINERDAVSHSRLVEALASGDLALRIHAAATILSEEAETRAVLVQVGSLHVGVGDEDLLRVMRHPDAVRSALLLVEGGGQTGRRWMRLRREQQTYIALAGGGTLGRVRVRSRYGDGWLVLAPLHLELGEPWAQRLVATAATLIGATVDREHLEREAHDADVLRDAERMRGALLKRDASRGVSALGVAELVEELLLLRVMQPQNGVHAIQQTLELNALSVGGPARRQVSLKRAKLTGL